MILSKIINRYSFTYAYMCMVVGDVSPSIYKVHIYIIIHIWCSQEYSQNSHSEMDSEHTYMYIHWKKHGFLVLEMQNRLTFPGQHVFVLWLAIPPDWQSVLFHRGRRHSFQRQGDEDRDPTERDLYPVGTGGAATTGRLGAFACPPQLSVSVHKAGW